MRSNLISVNKEGAHFAGKKLWIFLFFWAYVFVLYLPAAHAGLVGDYPGWVNFLNSVKFTDYINRAGSTIPSMYQFTQVVTYCFYKLFGSNAWLWHLLFVTMQAVNALLLFKFAESLFQRSGMRNASMTAFAGVTLFCSSPYISEVVVWEPAFHYLLGLMLLLVVLLCVQQYIYGQNKKYLWLGAITFCLSTYSLEFFYLTPFFTVLLIAFYYSTPDTDKQTLRRALVYCLLPQVVLFAAHFIVLHGFFPDDIAHIRTVSSPMSVSNLSKALKYFFHLLLLGRFWPEQLRSKIYAYTETTVALASAYAIVALLLISVISRYKRITVARKAIVLLLLYTLLAVALLLPLSFPDFGLIIYDRYTYLLDAFFYLLIAAGINSFVGRKAFAGIMAFYIIINLRYTHKANAYWQQSAQVVNNLVKTFPNELAKKYCC